MIFILLYYIMWIIRTLGIVILLFVYMYLERLKTCKCVKDVYVTRLKYLEGFMIVTSVIIFIFATLTSHHYINLFKSHASIILKLFVLYIIIMILLQAYFVYNAYKFSSTMEKPCDCADKWPKYYIYLQSIMAVITVLFSTIFAVIVITKKIPINDIGEKAVSQMGKAVDSIRRSSKRSKSH